MPKTEDVIIPMHQKLAVGAIAGVIGTICIFPIDVVKTRLQNQRPDASGKLMYKGVRDAFSTIVKKEGIASMYKGLIPNLIGVTPEKAIKLGANDYFREKLTNPITGELSLPRQMLAGASAGFCQVAATNPMEIVKLRMQLQNLKPVAERQSAAQVVRGLGLRGMYKGTVVTWMRDVPYSFFFFPGYAVLKDLLSNADGHASLPAIITAGCIAGASAAFICTPMDCIKTRYQAEGAHYKSIPDCFTQTVSKEGYSALFKGAVPRMSVTAPLFGIALVFFEMQKRYIKGESLL